MRDKNGRFIKNKKLELNIPSLATFLTFTFLIFIFTPWIYLLLSKFNLMGNLQRLLSELFGPGECTCPSQTPY